MNTMLARMTACASGAFLAGACQNDPSKHTNRHAVSMPNPARPIEASTRGKPARASSCARACARSSNDPRYSPTLLPRTTSCHDRARHKPDASGNTVTVASATQPSIADTISTSTAASTADEGARNSASSCVTLA